MEEARLFYVNVLGCTEVTQRLQLLHCKRQLLRHGESLAVVQGRSASTWRDFNFYGHQIVAHLVVGYQATSNENAVDGDAVPVPHFGAALSVDQFHALAKRVKDAGVPFVIEPHIRFVGAPGEQWTMFFRDPSGNSLEFKAMTHPDNLFAKYRVD